MSRKTPVIIAGMNCLSGITSWADRLRDAFHNHPRYQVQTLYLGPESTLPDSIDPADIWVHTPDEALRVLRALAPAIVIPNYVWALFLSGFEPGIRCLGMCHADDEDQYYRPLNWYEPTITKFVAVSKECHKRLNNYVPCRSSDITTLPYGVSVPSNLNRNYQAKPLRLIYAGRVTQPQKRVWDFVPLVEHLLRARVPFEFDIIGEGDEFAPLAQVMGTRLPAANVRFHPRVPHREMAAQWLSHDVFLQVSDFEGTSVSMLEAMAHGAVPVVTAASSGVEGVIRSEENGFVVPVGDMAGMAQVLAKLAGDRSIVENAGRASYQTAQSYSMDLYAEKFSQILDQVADAAEHVECHERYGRYSPNHPLLVQRQLLQPTKDESEQHNERSLKRLWKKGWKGIRFSKANRNSRDDRRVA